MFRIFVRSLKTETYQPLPCGPYQTRGEAEDAIKHMLVQVRPEGEYIVPEEYEIAEE